MRSERVKTTVRIDRKLLQAARYQALAEAKSLRQILEEGLRAYMKGKAKKERTPINADADPRNADWIKIVGRLKRKGSSDLADGQGNKPEIENREGGRDE